MEIGATAHWFGGEEALAARVYAWADERRLAVKLAIANTLGAAWAVVHFGATSPQIVPPQGAADAIAHFPVESLRLSGPTLGVLRELGIDAVGVVASLPRSVVAERFAPELLLRLDQALGSADELFDAFRPPPEYDASASWESAVESMELLVVACERLLPRLTAPLAARGQGAARVVVELTSESHRLRRLVVGLLRPTLDVRHLLDLLRLRLESCRLVEPVAGVRLAVLEEAPLSVEQRTLFADVAPPVESHAWQTLVERLAGRLGNDAVCRVRTVADHQPERAWAFEPWLESRTSTTTAIRKRAKKKIRLPSPLVGEGLGVRGEDAADASPRPPLLLREPRTIRVVASQPGGRPGQFRDGATEHRIVRSWGPERIETGWWRAPSIRRDYYRVETAAGTHYWLYRDLRTRAWFLHGWFD